MPTDQDQIGDSAGELTESEKRIAEERTALRAAVIHEAIRTEGEAELLRPASALMWSGMAAGLSMGFSLAAMGLLYSRLPDTQWRPLITDLGYTVGFLVVILGRQHLYTENTLTVDASAAYKSRPKNLLGSASLMERRAGRECTRRGNDRVGDR